MAKDPVCGMVVGEEDRNPFRLEYKDKVYFFCGEGCVDRFRKDPEGYLNGEKKDWIRGE